MTTCGRPNFVFTSLMYGITVMCAVLMLAACAQRPLVHSTSDATVAPSFVAGPITSTTRVLAIDDLVQPVGSKTLFAVLTGDRKGETIEVSVELDAATGEPVAAESASGKSRLRLVERVQRKPGDWRVTDEMLLARSRDEARLVEVVTHSEDSISRFSAPLPFAAPLKSDAMLEGTSPMQVVTISRGRERGKGSASRTLKIVGECDIEVSGKKFRAIAVELVFEADLDVADARFRATMYVVEGEGIVAEVRREDVRILGIFPRGRDETVVRVERLDTPKSRRTLEVSAP